MYGLQKKACWKCIFFYIKVYSSINSWLFKEFYNTILCVMHLVPVKTLRSSLWWIYFFPHPLKKSHLILSGVWHLVFFCKMLSMSAYMYNPLWLFLEAYVMFWSGMMIISVTNEQFMSTWHTYECQECDTLFCFTVASLNWYFLHHYRLFVLKNDGNRKKNRF